MHANSNDNNINQWWLIDPHSLNEFEFTPNTHGYAHDYPGLTFAFTTTSTSISLGFIPKMKKCNKPLWERFPNGKGLYL